MKKNYLFIYLFIAIVQFSFAQQETCIISNGSSNQSYAPIPYAVTRTAANEPNICLNVYFHLVRNNDGTGASNKLLNFETNTIIDDLNTVYNPYNISFVKKGQDQINNTLLNDLQLSEQSTLFGINNDPNAINYYIVDNIDYAYGAVEKILSHNLVIMPDYARSNTSSHEVGHCLNLWHTHHGMPGYEGPTQSDPYACEELVNGDLSNRRNCGDYVTDTPADPGLRKKNKYPYEYYVDNLCNYTENNSYNPDTENIMSYTSPNCLRYFSNLQAIRMRDAILESPVLQQTINYSCSDVELFGKRNICATESSTYTISMPNSSFSVSSNLQILSSTINSVTVKAINAAVNDVAYITATSGSTTKTKQIWVGKPKADVLLSPDANYVGLNIVGQNANLDDQFITSIEWRILNITGNATMGASPDNYENLAHGNGFNWVINAEIVITNDCDSLKVLKDITPEQQEPCDEGYGLAQTETNVYSVQRIIEPCDDDSGNGYKLANKKQSDLFLQDNEVHTAILYNIYGKKMLTFKHQNYFDLNTVNPGVYILWVQTQTENIIKKIIVQ